MLRHTASLIALMISSGLGCSQSHPADQPTQRPRSLVDAQPEPITSVTQADPALELVEAGSHDEASVYEQLLAAGFVAVFAEDGGVIAYDVTGSSTVIVDEPFNWMTIDYHAGLMWLDRSWSQTHVPGLYVVDLMAPEVQLTKVTRLQRNQEIVGFDGEALPMTEGNVPYRVRLDADPVVITLDLDERQCGEECNPTAESVALFDAVRLRGLEVTGAGVHRLVAPAQRVKELALGYSIPLGQLPLSLRLIKGVPQAGDGIHWQLYDERTSEYVASGDLSRSKRPQDRVQQVRHLMVCEGEETLVVERAFLTKDFVRLDHRQPGSYGLCLGGGILFQDRIGYRFMDPEDQSGR